MYTGISPFDLSNPANDVALGEQLVIGGARSGNGFMYYEGPVTTHYGVNDTGQHFHGPLRDFLYMRDLKLAVPGQQHLGLSGSPAVGACGYAGVAHASGRWTSAPNLTTDYGWVIPKSMVLECLHQFPQVWTRCNVSKRDLPFLHSCGV